MKKCKKCGLPKENKEFYSHPDYKDGFMNKCKECILSEAKKRWADKPAKIQNWYIFD